MKKGQISLTTILWMGIMTTKMYAQSLNAPTNFATSQPTNNSISLSWTAANDSSVVGYIIIQGQSPNPVDGDPIPMAGPSTFILNSRLTTSYTARSLSPSTLYEFHIYSYDTSGGTTAYSTIMSTSGTTLARAPMQGPTIVSTTSASNSIALSVNQGGASGYFLLRFTDLNTRDNYTPTNGVEITSGSNITIVARSAGNTINDTGLTPNTQYYYQMYNYNGNADSIHYNSTPAQTNISTLPQDIIQPTISQITFSTNTINFNSTQQTITIAFSESMNRNVSPTIDFGNSASNWSINANGVNRWIANNLYIATYNYNTVPNNSNIEDSVRISVTNLNNLEDLAGNTALQNDTSSFFILDCRRPTAEINPTNNSPYIKAGDSLDIVVYFSEPINDNRSPALNITVNSQNVVNNQTMIKGYDSMRQSITYMHRFVVTSNVPEGTATVTLSNIEDLRGNTMTTIPTNNTFTIDKTAPIVNTLSPQDNAFNVATNTRLTITFTEKIKLLVTTDSLSIYSNQSGSTPATLFARYPITANNIQNNTLTVNLGNDSLAQGTNYYITLNANIISDLAGNTFSGITTASRWDFTTFSPAEIDSLILNNGVTAVCLGSDVRLTGNFFTGVMKASFGGNNGISIGSSDLSLRGDSLLILSIPDSLGSFTPLILYKVDHRGDSILTQFSQPTSIGPNSARIDNLQNPTKNSAEVCSESSTGATDVETILDVNGGTAPYEITYRIQNQAKNLDKTVTLTNHYTTDTTNINPDSTGTNIISITSAKDANKCPVVSSRLGNSLTITEHAQPKVSAGILNSGDSVEICLSSTQTNIVLNNSILPQNPSLENVGTNATVVWQSTGQGTFQDSTALIPTYNIVNGDILNGEINFSIRTENYPSVCEQNSSNFLLIFTNEATAQAGGQGGLQTVCWDGISNTVAVQLKGTISGATGYQWATSSGQTPGTFSNDSIQNPIYTLSQQQIQARRAQINLVATNSSCGSGNDSQPSELTIQLATVATSRLNNPKNNVCSKERVSYEITSVNPGSTFIWNILQRRGNFAATRNNAPYTTTAGQVTIQWDSLPGNDSLSVITQNANGCQSQPFTVPITIYNNANQGIKRPTIFSFSRNSRRELLQGHDNTLDSAEFSGDAVITFRDQNDKILYYFDPSLAWELSSVSSNNGLTKTANVRYRYKIGAAQCYSPYAEQVFTVYDGSQAFNLELIHQNSLDRVRIEDGDYYICGNTPVRIEINNEFFNVNPLQSNHVFKGFTLDDPIISRSILDSVKPLVNHIDPADPNSGYAILYPERVNGLMASINNVDGEITFPVRVEINGWQYDPNNPLPTGVLPPGYGRIYIVINRVPGLSPNSLPQIVCSDTELQLGKNESTNPGTSYQFFLDTQSPPNLIEGDSITGFTLSPSNLGQNTNPYPSPREVTIKYRYTNENYCSDSIDLNAIRIVQRPDPPQVGDKSGSSATVFCSQSASSQRFDSLFIYSRAQYSFIPNGATTPQTVKASINWYRNSALRDIDRVSLDTTYFPPENGTINILYVTQTIESCISQPTQILLQTPSLPEINWDLPCIEKTGGVVNFTANLQNQNAQSFIWKIQEDPSSETVIMGNNNQMINFSYRFPKPGRYHLQLSLENSQGCKDSTIQAVSILQNIDFSTIPSYLESFDTDDGYFVAAPDSRSQNGLFTWKHGNMNKQNQPSRDMESPVWTTNLDGPYGNGERSYLYVGCMDLSSISSPIVSFDTWLNFDTENDGAVLQYSTDNQVVDKPGKQWNAVGRLQTGINWYDHQLIQSTPNTAIDNYGWSNKNTNWVSAKHSLQDAKNQQIANSDNTVILRFSFAATLTALDIGKTLSGFALDNFFIGPRTRIVLLENFTNAGNTGRTSAQEKRQNDYISSFYPNNVGTELVKINYHTGFPDIDPFNEDNARDPSGRALYYGLTSTPIAFIDGQRPAEAEQNGRQVYFQTWGEKENAIRALEPSNVDIEVNVDNSQDIPDDRIGITVTITPQSIDIPAGEARLYISIIENSVDKSDLPEIKQNLIKTGEDVFEYVLKAMLPSSSGIELDDVLRSGTSYTFGPFFWVPQASKIYNNRSIRAIAFLQNEETREVYQTGITENNLPIPTLVTAIQESGPLSQLQVYPNPANQYINIQLPYQANNDLYIKILDVKGVQIGNIQSFPRGAKMHKLSTHSLNEGTYILEIQSKNDPPIHKKIIISHNRR